MLVIIGGSWHPNFGDMVLGAVEAVKKPAAFVTMGMMPIAPTKGIAVYPDGRRAAMALGKLAKYQRFREDDWR
jgi:acyl-CoA synthetase (NDP forming)